MPFTTRRAVGDLHLTILYKKIISVRLVPHKPPLMTHSKISPHFAIARVDCIIEIWSLIN